MKNYREVKIGILIVAIATIIAAAFFGYTVWKPVPVSISVSNPIPPAPEKDQWVTYHNKAYGYSVYYPSSLYVDDRVPDKIYFTDEYLYGIIAVEVASTTYVKVEDELKAKNEKYNSHDFLEKRIKIAGYGAIVTYPVSKVDAFPDQAESFPDEKTVLLIKDGLLFRIGTRGIDHERIWNSFRFE